jgi:ATP-dependent Lon protease
MRHTWIFAICILIFLFGCKNKNSIDLAELTTIINQTNDLGDQFTQSYNTTLHGIYKISDDSIVADSISEMITLPDTLLFFEYLEQNINLINDSYYTIQQEIFFAQDQLDEMKKDVDKKRISDVQYYMQLESQKEMIETLRERVESNISIFQDISNTLHIIKDTTNNE